MKRVIALGFFDGVHVGHRALLDVAKMRAQARNCTATALTFDPHPNALIFGEKTPLINTLEERRLLMTEQYRMDEMLVLPFDRAFMELDWQDFVKEVLVKRFEAVHLVCGFDYTFGHRGLGNAQNLQDLCKELGLGCDVVNKVELLGTEVSSSRIRALLEQGRVEEANALLGHPHFVSGTVTHGKKLGRILGFPTANLPLGEDRVVPARGVYATRVVCGASVYASVTNVGSRPTVGTSTQITLESHLLDFAGDLYGKTITVEFETFLRPETKFASVEELTAAIRQDAASARAFFSDNKAKPRV